MTERKIYRLGASDRQRSFGLAVPSDRGIFAWQDFARREHQHDVPEWAWKACQKGPFTTPLSRLVFALNLFWARLKRENEPIHVATWRSIGFASNRYFSAYSEVQEKWRKNSLGFDMICIQEDNFEINYYICSEKK